jgi:tight adherence protein C
MTTTIEIITGLFAAGAVFFFVVFLARAASRYFRVSDEALEEAKKEAEEDKPSYLRLLVRTWGEKLNPRVPTGLRDDLSKKIVMAGGLSGLTPAEVVLYAAFSTLVGLGFGLLLVVSTDWPAVLVLGCTVIGSLFPFLWLRDQVKRRHQEILADLAFHLDLLTLTVEAGLDFGAGVARMVEKGKPGALRHEFATFLAQLRVGKTRAEALEAMSQRVGLEQLSTFLSALIQADRMGTGLGRTLRLQADQIRTDRFQRAEKLAGEAPVKMLIPLVMFIFPTIWVILGAPLVFDWVFRGGP